MTSNIRHYLTISLLIALIAWGGFTFIRFMGVDVHQAALISPELQQTISNQCGMTNWFCRGFFGTFMMLWHFLQRLGPFVPYILISAIVYGGVLLMQYLNEGRWRFRVNLRPWALILIVVGFTWLLFTTQAMSSIGDTPLLRLTEPNSQTYPNAAEQSLIALRDNFTSLQSRGCLNPVPGQQFQYDLAMSCVQQSFITRVLPQVAIVLSLLLITLTLGRALLSGALGLRFSSFMLEAFLSAMTGSGLLIVVLWLFALIGVYTPTTGWVLLPAILVAGYRYAWYWLTQLHERVLEIDDTWYSPRALLFWVLLTVLALNFLSVIRPFPIGWDDLGRYLNQPRLLVSYGQLIPDLAAFQWEYITSLPYLLFGYDATISTTGAMVVNWAAGLLAVAAVYVVSRLFLSPASSILAALLYYSLPMVGHFSFADMKTDNAVLAMSAAGVLAGLLYLFASVPSVRLQVHGSESDDEGEQSPNRYGPRMLLLLTGLLLGFAFSIKPTAIIASVTLLTLMAGVMVHYSAFLATFFVGWALYTFMGRVNVIDLSQRLFGSSEAVSSTVVMGLFLLIAAGFAVWSFVSYRGRSLALGRSYGWILVGALVATVPWLMLTNIPRGNIIPQPIFTAVDTFRPVFHATDDPAPESDAVVRSLPPELAIDPSHPVCQSTAKVEELDRYWGYRDGIGHYLGLPWRSVMNLDIQGYYVTTYPALLLMPLILLVPFFWRREGRWLRWLFVASAFMLLQWMFLANGVLWYGIVMFLGFSVLLATLVDKAPSTSTRWIAGVLIGLSIATGLGHRLWQYDQQRNLYEYALGKSSAYAMQERTIPYYDDIRDAVLQRAEELPDRPYLYRMGTFIPFFIPRNLEYVPIADNQLEFFNCLHQERDGRLTTARLKALGFNAILFDTNTATIEKNPQGTLHKKVEAFAEYVNDPDSGIRILVNDLQAGLAFMLIP